MDKTQSSPTRENYEEMEGLTPEQIENRVRWAEITSPIRVQQEAVEILNRVFAVKKGD